PDQLLHGEPHPGNVLRTRDGLLFVDLETCCRGPIEFDIAHATVGAGGPPMEVAGHYAGADPTLVRQCWVLMLAMVTAWRCEPGDDLPDGEAKARSWIRQLRGELEPTDVQAGRITSGRNAVGSTAPSERRRNR
ncbi:MAG TPA: phosphotransferase, partial [Acidimicrobiales bacterium]|nr:phosphotransferase [Acidimicrobiales bacterium]